VYLECAHLAFPTTLVVLVSEGFPKVKVQTAEYFPDVTISLDGDMSVCQSDIAQLSDAEFL